MRPGLKGRQESKLVVCCRAAGRRKLSCRGGRDLRGPQLNPPSPTKAPHTGTTAYRGRRPSFYPAVGSVALCFHCSSIPNCGVTRNRSNRFRFR